MRSPGVSVFETMRVRRGAIPLLSRHLARLSRSLAALGLPAADRDLDAFVVPFTEMDEAVLHLEVRDGRAAVTVGGVPGGGPPVVITAVARHERYPHKTTERDCFEEAAAEADRAEADDALLLTAEGWVTEGTVWNLLWWEGERLCTPGQDLGILPGVGRARIGELVRVEEGHWRREALDGRSLFLTSAVRGVVPLARLDGAPVPLDPRTAEIARAFWPD
ncbi:MAG TPA: aminotransferase class IV [Gemmatimonadales bacterium]|nr:aminotransferase class IV [Gemmatimonadales bacterium]